MNILRSICAAVFGLTIFASSPVWAGSCGYDYCWGAVAVGDRGKAARASGLRTAPAASDRADKVCRGGCDVIEVFHNGCGAIVEGGRAPERFSGFAGSREGAEQEAMGLCQAAGHRSCRTRVWACSK